MSAITKNDKIVTADILQDYHDQHVAPFLGGNVLGAQSNFKNSDIYSTTERIVGCWTDGRPLYQVLVPISTGAINTWYEESISTSIISTPASVVFRTVQAYIESNGGVLYNINNEVGNNNGCGFCLGKASSSNQVCYGTYPNYADFANKTGYMVIQYTRTTDAAGSYYLAGENDYSTDEKIIGKWIDGKNIYRKVITGISVEAGNTSTQTTKDYSLSGTNISTMIDIKSKIVVGNIQTFGGNNINKAVSNSSVDRLEVRYDSGNNKLTILNTGSAATVDVILEYTKTS